MFKPASEPDADVAWRVLRGTLDRLVRHLPLKRVETAFGRSPPEPRATISQSPRIVICLSGRNRMTIPRGAKAVAIELRPHEAVYVAERAWNRPLHLCTHTFLTLDFKPEWIRYFLRDHALDEAGSTTHCYFRSGSIKATGGHILRGLEALLDGAPCQPTLEALVAALLHQARRECTPPHRGDRQRALTTWRHCCQYIDDHLDRDVRREDVANHVRLHPNHISRLFRQCGQESFKRYLQRRRMEQAACLLLRYDLSIKEIAHCCGFHEPSYFHQIFLRTYGMTPGEYRAARKRRSRCLAV